MTGAPSSLTSLAALFAELAAIEDQSDGCLACGRSRCDCDYRYELARDERDGDQ